MVLDRNASNIQSSSSCTQGKKKKKILIRVLNPYVTPYGTQTSRKEVCQIYRKKMHDNIS
jgi:hypothetical protein